MLVVPRKQFIMFKPFPPSPPTYLLPLWKTQLSPGLCSGLGLSVEWGRRRLRKPSAPMGALEAVLPFSLSPLLLVLIHSFVRSPLMHSFTCPSALPSAPWHSLNTT